MLTTRIAIVCPKLIFSSNLGDVDEKKKYTFLWKKLQLKSKEKYPKYFYLNIRIFSLEKNWSRILHDDKLEGALQKSSNFSILNKMWIEDIVDRA